MRTKQENFDKIATRLIKKVRTVLDVQELKLRETAVNKGFNVEEEMEQKETISNVKNKADKLGE